MYSVLTIVCHTYSCSCSSHGLWTPTSLWHPGTWLHTHSWACTGARNSCGLLRDEEIKGSKTTAGFDTKTTISLCVIQTHTHTRFHILVRASDWHNDVPSPLTPTMTPNHFLSLCLKIQKYQHLVPLMMMFKQGHTHTHTHSNRTALWRVSRHFHRASCTTSVQLTAMHIIVYSSNVEAITEAKNVQGNVRLADLTVHGCI